MSGNRRLQVTDEWLYTYVPVIDEAMVRSLEGEADGSYAVSEHCERKLQRLLRRERYGLYGQARKLMQRIAAVLVGIISVFGLATLGVQAFIILSAELDPALAEQYVMEEVERIMGEENPLCTWTEETEIEAAVPLYDYEDICFGYVYKLCTDGKETGYIQVNYLNRRIFTYCYSFDGMPAYEGLAEGGKEASDKLYFFGNMSYCYRTQDNMYTFLDGGGKMSQEEARDYFQETMYEVVQRRMELVKGNAEAKENHCCMEILQSLRPVTKEDFADSFAARPGGGMQLVVNHEIPVAATNMMLYFREGGESSLSTWISDDIVFQELYYKMNTNSITTESIPSATGTRWEDVVPGILNFCGARGCTPGIIGESTSVAPKKLKHHLDNGELLLLQPDGASEMDAGTVAVAFTYTDNALVLSLGWDRGYHYYPFETIDFDRYVYVRY